VGPLSRWGAAHLTRYEKQTKLIFYTKKFTAGKKLNMATVLVSCSKNVM
jgi:hypothetical protein